MKLEWEKRYTNKLGLGYHSDSTQILMCACFAYLMLSALNCLVI